MIRGLIVIGIVVLGFVPAPTGAKSPRALLQDGHVRVRVSTEPGRQVLIGQQTRFFVEILTDTWFTSAPDYPELVLDGAVALMPEQLGTNFTERIGGETFAAQRRSYVIFPQRAGPLEIPSLRIRLAVSQNGKAGTPFTVRTRALKLNVVLPAEAEGIDGLVTTPRLRVRDVWDRPLEGLKVGDAIKRTVQMDADRALGMLLPDLQFEVPEGIAAYPDQPRTEDQVNRGQYKGSRFETVTYVLQKPGEFTVPEIQVHWWSPARGRLSTETLAPRTFQVSGSAQAGLDPPAEAPPWWASWRSDLEELWTWLKEHALMILAALAALLVAVPILGRAFRALQARHLAARKRQLDSELRLFRNLRESARASDLDALFRDFWKWRERVATEFPALTAEGLARTADETGFTELWNDIERARYREGKSSVSGRELRRALQRYRGALLATRRTRPDAPLRLNPGG